MGRDQHVPVIDLYDTFRSQDELIDDSRFTEAGHRRAARIIHDRILPVINGGEGSRR